MKKVLLTLIFAMVLVLPLTVDAELHISFDNMTSNTVENSTTYNYEIFVSSDEPVDHDWAFIVHFNDNNYSNIGFNSVPGMEDELSVDNNADVMVAIRSVGEVTDEPKKLGEIYFTLPAGVNIEEAFEYNLAMGAAGPEYYDENNYSLMVSDVNDLSEYTIELLVGSLVFDFNENFDGTFTWEAQGDTGIKINNLSNKAIRVALDFKSNVEGLMYTGTAMQRLSNGICADYYTQYFEIGQDRSEHPLDWKSDVYTEPGLLDLVYYTDAECTEPLEYGSVYAENVDYYVIRNYSPAIVSNDKLLHDLVTIDAYNQSIYVPGLDIGVRLSGGTLEDVQRVQRGNKKIGTITVTIVGV